MERTAIVGAGVAGLAAAAELTRRGFDVHVFEKSRGVSGRAATRRKHDAAYDHGAQYFGIGTRTMHKLVRETLPAQDLIDIGGAIDTFDGAGRRAPGDPTLHRGGRWTYTDGISRLGKLLVTHASLNVRRQTRVTELEKTRAGWTLRDSGGSTYGPFGAVLVTAPGPQAAELIHNSRFESAIRARTVDVLRGSTYRSILSLVVCFDRSARKDDSFYALVNSDRDHPVSWLAYEEEKEGHVPAGQSLIIAQMADAWSRPRFRNVLEELVVEARPAIEDVVGHPLGDPLWVDKQGWLYALPEQVIPSSELDGASRVGLFFAGDAYAEGRVHRALEDGLEAAGRVAEWFGGER